MSERKRRCGRCRELKEISAFPYSKERIGLICNECVAAGRTNVLVHADVTSLTLVKKDDPSAPSSKFTYTNTRLVNQNIVLPLVSVFYQLSKGLRR